MQTIFRMIVVFAAAVLSSTVTWIGVLALTMFANPSNFISIPSNDGSINDRIRWAICLGLIHGILVAIGVLNGNPSKFVRCVALGFLATELGLVTLATWWVLGAWPAGSSVTNLINSIAFVFIIGSVLCLLPTLFISLISASVQKLFLGFR